MAQQGSGGLPRVLVLKPLPMFKYHLDLLEEKFNLLKAWESPLTPDEFLVKNAQSVQAMLCSGFTPVSAGVLQFLPALRIVVADSAGVNHIDLLECHRRGISVTNAGDVFSKDGADMAVGLLIDVLRKISAADRFVRQGLWSMEYPVGSKVGGRRVGIVGLGRIGKEIAKRLMSFDCTILYTSRTKHTSVPYTFYPNVVDLAANSNVLIICCTLTEQTRHMINKQVLAALGKHGVIINIGRGPIVDEKEMVKCLVEGEIAGAGLDVFENEPEVPDELFGLDNVVLSPHRAVFTMESLRESCGLVIGNLVAFFSNKPLLSPVKLNSLS